MVGAPQQNLLSEEGHAGKAQSQSQASLQSACVGWDIKTRSNQYPRVHWYYEERILCGQHPEGHAGTIYQPVLSRWIPFSAG